MDMPSGSSDVPLAVFRIFNKRAKWRRAQLKVSHLTSVPFLALINKCDGINVKSIRVCHDWPMAPEAFQDNDMIFCARKALNASPWMRYPIRHGCDALSRTAGRR